MESSQSAFYRRSLVDGLNASHRALCYAQSYTLVSYMINDGEGREHLRSYMNRLADVETAEDARQVTREMFTDKLLDAMVRPWLAYVNR